MAKDIEIVFPVPKGYKNVTDLELEKKIVELRHKGFRFTEIATATGEAYDTVYKIYKEFEKEHEDELFASRMGKVIELDTIYPKTMSIINEELELSRLSKQPQATAAWLKLTLEAAREYREFLESIGFIDKTMTSEIIKHKTVTTEASDPILELIKLNRLKLTEELKKEEVTPNATTEPSTESTV